MRIQRAVLVIAGAVAVAACGSGTSAPASAPTPRATPTETTTATPTSAPSPTAVPVSGPPLAVLYDSSPASTAQQLEVMNGEGVKQWGLTVAQEGQYFGLTAQQYGPGSNAPQIGGSDLYFFFQSTPSSANQVAVVSRTGTLVGLGTAPAVNPNVNGMGPFQVSPTGTEWAWTTDETPNASGKHQGVVEVGGLGEANRVVYRWAAPVGFTEELVDWTNAGIIMQRIPQGNPFFCGGNALPGIAWFAINPSTDTLTELFSVPNQYQDARSGVTVATPIDGPHTVLINGVSYSESKSVVAFANVSPDGTHVAIFRQSFNPCGGGDIPTTSIEVVTVANRSHYDLGLYFEGWFGNADIFAANAAGDTWVYTLDGTPVIEMNPVASAWQILGALS